MNVWVRLLWLTGSAVWFLLAVSTGSVLLKALGGFAAGLSAYQVIRLGRKEGE